MPDLLIELRSEEIPARPLARSGAAVRTGKGKNTMRSTMMEPN
jgi:glycyl-tRNA synthetase beta subunit